jgi:hypothetical protein
MMSRASRRRSRVIMSRRQKVMIKALRLAAFILPFSMKGSKVVRPLEPCVIVTQLHSQHVGCVPRLA